MSFITKWYILETELNPNPFNTIVYEHTFNIEEPT